jgi:hypothetical protein
MKVEKLNKELNRLLKKFIKDNDHIDTGALYKSIDFDCTWDGIDLDIRFGSEYYIVFLEQGDFINDFFELTDVLSLIGDFYVENLDI